MVVVALGFAASTFLIHSSFADWAESPVATTITPHSVADLPFPNVTICPPKGLNGALKYDLMKLKNKSLSLEKKEELLRNVALILNKEGGKSFAKLISEKNIETLYEGYQEVTQESDVITVKMSNPAGTFESPFHRQNLTDHLRRQLRKQKIHFQLELDLIKEKLGDEGKIMLEMQVDQGMEGKLKVGLNLNLSYDCLYESFTIHVNAQTYDPTISLCSHIYILRWPYLTSTTSFEKT